MDRPVIYSDNINFVSSVSRLPKWEVAAEMKYLKGDNHEQYD